ncbi:pseudouridine-5'-phosphate glycosidase [Angustibacter sp. McL0619]|uniref:pseudouridine-5'-phosphate glycosidase n=1 Tax=Angustibacter sp. McL0619 TaxID=3415676 RepID=UPI003CF95370
MITLSDEVRDALADGAPVVALESTIISHGLPRPDNLRVAREIEQAVRDAGAVPATVALVAGRVRIGLDDDALATVAGDDSVLKVSVRDLAVVAARGGHGATTVASTAHLAARAGIAVFATGGLGGVHRGASTTFDESADLVTLSRVPTTVVCAGVKSILDIAATLERMETLGIGLVGYRTDRFPGFYLTDSGHPVEHRVDDPAEVAAVMRARAALGTDRAGLVVANPLPEDEQLDPVLHDRVLAAALAGADAEGVHGKETTPYLLARFHQDTQGRSLAVNTRIILRNARLAAQIALAHAVAG